MANSINPSPRSLSRLCCGLLSRVPGMKYDLRRVEEVYYDVKIRGLASDDSAQGQVNATPDQAMES